MSHVLLPLPEVKSQLDISHGLEAEQDLAQDFTQANTQDPRRLGLTYSGFDDSDIADIICVLHPCSVAACKVVARSTLRCPQHILQNRKVDDSGPELSLDDIEERETFILEGNTPQESLDLALRFSSRMRNPLMGFTFGRNDQMCDIILDQDTVRRVSNTHFRIYINHQGACMLQDVSTNGTMVDNCHLRGKGNPVPQTRMLTHGSIIQILTQRNEETLKFIVRIPTRDGHEDEYAERFRNYMERIAEVEAQTIDSQNNNPQARHVGQQIQPAPAIAPSYAAIRITNPQVRQHSLGMKWNGAPKYQVVGHLGKGAFATVYTLATRSGGEYFAAKELEKRRFMKNGVLDRKLENELNIMKSISHSNIVRYIDYHDHDQHLYIIMEYLPCGDLQQHLTANGPLLEFVAMNMARQIFDALAYLHNNKITHRDIKPDNILIANNTPRYFWAKLSDFGLSKVVKEGSTFLKTFCGTLLYCAPEVFPHWDSGSASQGVKRDRRGGPPTPRKYHSYSQSVDIWSFGAVLWYSLCGRPPFEGVLDNTGRGMFERITSTSVDTSVLQSMNISGAGIRLLSDMLTIDPASRPSASRCLRHSWFAPLDITQDGADEGKSGLNAIQEEDEYASPGAEPDLSQLDINGEEFDEWDVEDIAEGGFADLRMSKRVKYCNTSNLGSSGQQRQIRAQPIAAGSSDTRPAKERLFGEITQPAFGKGNDEGNARPHTSGPSTASASGGEEYRSAVADQSKAFQSGQAQSEHHIFGSQLDSTNLMGAESMVRDLNMDSPQSVTSHSAEGDEPTTPKTPVDQRDLSQADGTTEETPKQAQDDTPKARVFSRQIDLPISASFFYDPHDPSTHNVEYASLRSGFDFVSTATVSTAQLAALSRTSAPALLATAEPLNQPLALQPAVEFARPAPRLGHLIATPESFAVITITLSSLTTTWGRGPKNQVVYSDGQDTRVPKRGIIIHFDAKGISECAQSGGDWTKLPGLHTLISTESRNGIYINGTKLLSGDGEGKRFYGKVYSGDIVTVYPGSEKKRGLAFVCEFFHGEGKQSRGRNNHQFEVLSKNGAQSRDSSRDGA